MENAGQQEKQSSSPKPFLADIKEVLIEQTYSNIWDFEDRAFFAPLSPNIRITTGTGSIYGADRLTINKSISTATTDTITANGIYPISSVGIDSTTTGSITQYANTVYIRDTIFNGPVTFNTNTNFVLENCVIDNVPSFFIPSAQSKLDKLKWKIREQLQPKLLNHLGNRMRATDRCANFQGSQANEIIALQLLRQMVEPQVFKKYLKYGFVTVKGPSGLVYQIKKQSHIITVWENGQILSTLCVYLKDKSIPPTDEVIAKMLICECDEADIWERANVSWQAIQKAKDSNRIQILGVRSKLDKYGDRLAA